MRFYIPTTKKGMCVTATVAEIWPFHWNAKLLLFVISNIVYELWALLWSVWFCTQKIIWSHQFWLQCLQNILKFFDIMFDCTQIPTRWCHYPKCDRNGTFFYVFLTWIPNHICFNSFKFYKNTQWMYTSINSCIYPRFKESNVDVKFVDDATKMASMPYTVKKIIYI